MPTFLIISKHSPESCWRFNEEARKVSLDLVNSLDRIEKKYKIKMMGWWWVLSEHTLYEVLDAPSLEALEKMSQEPEMAKWSAYHTMEIKLAYPAGDLIPMLKNP